MKKRKFTAPTLEVKIIGITDVVTVSPGNDGEWDFDDSSTPQENQEG